MRASGGNIMALGSSGSETGTRVFRFCFLPGGLQRRQVYFREAGRTDGRKAKVKTAEGTLSGDEMQQLNRFLGMTI